MITSESKTCAQALGVFQLGRSVFCGHQVEVDGTFCAVHGHQPPNTPRPAYLQSLQNLTDSAQMELRWTAG